MVPAPDSVVTTQLSRIYLQQVDPIIKILHRPSLEKLLLHEGLYLGYPNGHSAVSALTCAVAYSAACSMTENQCRSILHVEKGVLISACRKSCECAIEKAGLLTTRDMTVLQAFVLYLVSPATHNYPDSVCFSN
jgi:hypothetical protein